MGINRNALIMFVVFVAIVLGAMLTRNGQKSTSATVDASARGARATARRANQSTRGNTVVGASPGAARADDNPFPETLRDVFVSDDDPDLFLSAAYGVPMADFLGECADDVKPGFYLVRINYDLDEDGTAHFVDAVIDPDPRGDRTDSVKLIPCVNQYAADEVAHPRSWPGWAGTSETMQAATWMRFPVQDGEAYRLAVEHGWKPPSQSRKHASN